MSAVCYLISNSLAPPSLQAAWVIKAADEDKLQYTSLHSAACYRVSQSGQSDVEPIFREITSPLGVSHVRIFAH